jgi:hypothetical protein
MTKEEIEQEDKSPIGIAVDILIKKRDRLLDDYKSKIIDMSQTYNLDRDQTLYSDLRKISEDLQFVSHILALIRNQTRFAIDD